MRRNVASLAAIAGLLAMSVGGSDPVMTVPAKNIDSNDGRKERRVWSPAARRYVLKEGNSPVDNALRERAEAKRQRRAIARAASRPSAGGRQP